MAMDFKDFEGYKTDVPLQQELKDKSKKKAGLMKSSLIEGGLCILILFFITLFGLEKLKYVVYILVLFVFVLLFFMVIYIPPWIPPKCEKCGKRMKKGYKNRTGDREVFFVCKKCKLKASTFIIDGN